MSEFERLLSDILEAEKRKLARILACRADGATTDDEIDDQQIAVARAGLDLARERQRLNPKP